MATKTKTFALNGTHTAGIFADMSVDGPIIGTLVAIVDRAKNLPNRKTIGKQDPYCAARLGKEAKKTKTDIRGGQTPRWDQELRFTVHDGPDYFQLKISVFTDDKRTDLIGESWIDLKGIILPGGGQADLWQQLTCKGKYAGDIRLEITFYDARPKPDKPVAKARPQPASADQDNGPVKQRTPMKRRPLPSDPVTGEAPPSSPADMAPTPSPAPAPGPSRSSTSVDQYQTPPRAAHGPRPSQGGYISSHSPLQSVEYQGSPSSHRGRHQDQYPVSQQGQGYYQTPPRQEPSRQPQRQVDPYGTSPRHAEDYDHIPTSSTPPYHQPESRGPSRSEQFDLHFRDETSTSPSAMHDDRPPPPPAHRSRHNSGGQELAHRSSNSFDAAGSKAPLPASMRHDVLKHEAHRQSMVAYSGRPAFRGYDSAPSGMVAYDDQTYEPPMARHHSHDSVYDQHQRSMQATVEDVPDCPGDPAMYGETHRRGASRSYNHEPIYDRDPSPAPLNLSRSREASPLHHPPSPVPSRDVYEDYGGHSSALTHVPSAGYSTSPGRDPYFAASQSQPPGYQDEWSMRRNSYSMPDLPPSLIPGMDPNPPQDLSERDWDERGREERDYDWRQSSHSNAPIRGRHLLEGPASSSSHDMVPSNALVHTPQYPTYERQTSRGYPAEPEPRMRQYRSVSPIPTASPQHTIRRKSVSPAPPPSEQRRLSDVPFSPDSYDAYNTGAREVRSIMDPDAKIISHDGKEIDPSDHLPVESWAPEPEAKPHKQASQESRSRPAPSGAQPMPPSGRRQLRVAARPQHSQLVAHPSYGPQEPHAQPAPSAGRNRLQKRTNRSSGAHNFHDPTPLGPISSENYQDRPGAYTTNPNSRHHQWDYANENAEPGRGHGPPIPAKVPLPVMSGALGGSEELALEMQRIDIGAGRSRRRGGY